MHTKAFLVGFTLCASVLTAPLAGLQNEGNVSREAVAVLDRSSQVEQREEAAKKGEMNTAGLGIWKREARTEPTADAPSMQKRTGFGIISGGSNEEA